MPGLDTPVKLESFESTEHIIFIITSAHFKMRPVSFCDLSESAEYFDAVDSANFYLRFEDLTTSLVLCSQPNQAFCLSLLDI